MFEEIMTQNVTNLMKYTNLQIQEVGRTRTPNTINTK